MMYSFLDLESVWCSTSSSNVAFWTAYRFCRRQVRWSGIPISLRIFQSLLWSTQSMALVLSMKEKYMFIWNSLAFSMIQWMLAVWPLVPLPFLNSAWASAWEMSATVWWFEHSLVLPFLGTGMTIDLSQSCGHGWVFQICWCIECSTLRASSLRVMNSSTGIPLHRLALLKAVVRKACLTSHSRMSGSGCLTTSLWISSSLSYSSSMYSFHLFFISSAYTRSQPFLSLIVPTFGENVPLIFHILLKRSLAFPLLLFSSIFKHFSLKKSFLFSLLFFRILHLGGCNFPFSLAFHFFLQLFVKNPQITICLLAFFFPLGWFCSLLLYSITDLCP